MQIALLPWGLHEVPAALERGDADLMIGFADTIPARHLKQPVFDDTFTCIVRRGHPRARTRLTLKVWLELPHVLVSQRPGSPGAVDKALAALGKSRVVGARVSHFLVAPVVVARTDMVAAVSEHVADRFAPALGLQRFAPPIRLEKGTVSQIWHERVDTDPGHRWLRTVVAEECRRLPARPTLSRRARPPQRR